MFDPPFWIVLLERQEKGLYSVAKEIIGSSEPTNTEIVCFFDKLNRRRIRYSSPVEEEKTSKPKVNFKRMRREVRKTTRQEGVKHTYNKAHAELKKLREERKNEKKTTEKIQREENKTRKFELKQQKKKQKQRGH